MIKRVIGAVSASLLLGGLVAFAAPAGATVTSVAGCAGMKATGSIKSSVSGQGLTTADDQDASVSMKGVDPDTLKGSSLGACVFSGGLSTPDSSKPVVKGYSGGHSVLKWSAKFYSPEADCNTLDTGDLTEWPLNGALKMQFTDLNSKLKPQSLAANLAIDGFTDPDNDPGTPSDVVAAHGLVIKGVAAGADVATEVYFDPVFKDKTQTTAHPYFGYSLDILNAAGCATGDPANITAFVAGDGTSEFLALPAAGISLSIGQP